MIDEKCCENCDNYYDALCQIWDEDDDTIEDIESPMSEVCKQWEGIYND